MATTLFVVLTLSAAAHGQDDWSYPVKSATRPKTTHMKRLSNPTVAQIQAAVAPKTNIEVVGTVDASHGDVLQIAADDVRLDFTKAKQIMWSGGDTWNGFINISGRRVEVYKMRLKIPTASGKCRGVTLHTPAASVRISDCDFRGMADGFVADCNWDRLVIERTKFLNCGGWNSPDMPGGYGIFLNDNDAAPDNLRVSDVTITLAPTSAQHGMRVCGVRNSLIQHVHISANDKRSFWAYGVSNMAIRDSVFDVGSVLFNLMPYEYYTSQPVEHVRIDNCEIHHTTQLAPLSIYCGKGSSDFKIRNVDVTSTSSQQCLQIGWREPNGASQSQDIQWQNDAFTYNGAPCHGMQRCGISNDWTPQELHNLDIGFVANF